MVVFGSKKVKFGVKGFEPLNVGIKNRCLSTWLYSSLQTEGVLWTSPVTPSRHKGRKTALPIPTTTDAASRYGCAQPSCGWCTWFEWPVPGGLWPEGLRCLESWQSSFVVLTGCVQPCVHGSVVLEDQDLPLFGWGVLRGCTGYVH